MKQMCLLAGVCINLIVLSSASAATWYVDIDAPPGGNGASWQTAFQTIQPAIDAASAGDEIWVAQGIYNELREGFGSVILKNGVSLYGGFAGDETLRESRNIAAHPTTIDGYTSRDGNPAYCVIKIGDDTILEGFSICGANGSGVAFDGSRATIHKCSIYGNRCGINAHAVGVNISECHIENNHSEPSDFGGGIFVRGANIEDCVFVNNSSIRGGAIYLSDWSVVRIVGCAFQSNQAVHGSAIYVKGHYTPESPIIIDRCVFSENGPETIYQDCQESNSFSSAPASFITNSVFFDNAENDIYCVMNLTEEWLVDVICLEYKTPEVTTTGRGGMEKQAEGEDNCVYIYATSGSYLAIITNNTFVRSSGYFPGSVYCTSAPTPVTNCIFYNCAPANCDANYSLVFPSTDKDGNIQEDPRFVDPENNNFQLRSDSPCIDSGRDVSGTEFGSITADFLGISRPMDGDGLGAGTTGDGSDYDIGAYEYNGTIEGEEGEGVPSEGSPEEGEGQIEHHTADQNADYLINLSELLRVIQLYNSNGYHCQVGIEDGYAVGSIGDTSCTAHSSDYNPQDWQINLSELLRLIQFYNAAGYRYCPEEGSEDGFCPIVGAD